MVTQGDAINSFADALRARGGVESRSAVLGSERVEIIRGKDFGRWFRANVNKADIPYAKGMSEHMMENI